MSLGWLGLEPAQRYERARLAELLRDLNPLLAEAVERTGESMGPDGADVPVLVSVIETGALPDLVTTRVLERELRCLEQWVDQLRAPAPVRPDA